MTISRRSFLTGAAASLVTARVTLWSPLAASATARAQVTAKVLPITLANTAGVTLYVHVGGTDPASGRFFFLESDGHTRYFPTSPSQPNAPLQRHCAISVPKTRDIQIPYVNGARVWVSLGKPLVFRLNPGASADFPGIVEPSPNNPSDPNIDRQWGFCEFTYNATNVFANISSVDFVGVPIAMGFANGPHVGGLPAGGLDRVIQLLQAQSAKDGKPWKGLVRHGPGGTPVRALSPKQTAGAGFGDYFASYVNRVWETYSQKDLVVDTQAYGTVHGRVSNGQLTFPGIVSFTKPGTPAIFSCSGAPFVDTNDEAGNISARLAAGFNRSCLLRTGMQPAPGPYYAMSPTNHYARIVHAVEAGHTGYAFPYDDVHADGRAAPDGAITSGSARRLTITAKRPH